MIKGIGIDLCAVSRMETLVKRQGHKLKGRIFNEIEWNESVSSLAARWAAKEAFGKAMGTGIRGFDFIDVYVSIDEVGKPHLKLANKAASLFEKMGSGSLHLSLSHEEDMAAAVVIWETN